MKNTIICAGYFENKCFSLEYDKILKYMVENKSKFIFIFYDINEYGHVLMIFMAKELSKCKKKFKRSKKSLASINELLNGNVHQCTHCNSTIINYPRFTYRGGNGYCIGRSQECLICQGLDNETVRKISEIKNKKGNKKAVEFAISIL